MKISLVCLVWILVCVCLISVCWCCRLVLVLIRLVLVLSMLVLVVVRVVWKLWLLRWVSNWLVLIGWLFLIRMFWMKLVIFGVIRVKLVCI